MPFAVTPLAQYCLTSGEVRHIFLLLFPQG
jgi:hypothetical protein